MPLYDLPRIVIGLVIAIVFLVSVSFFLIKGEASWDIDESNAPSWKAKVWARCA